MSRRGTFLLGMALVAAAAVGCKTDAPATTGDTTPTQREGLTLTWAPAAVASHETVTDALSTAFTIETPNGPQQGVNTRTRVYHVEVVEAASDAVTRVNVHYEAFQETSEMNGARQAEDGPLHGKAYAVWVEGGAVRATSAAGGEVSADELAALTEQFDDELGRVPAMPQVLASQPWKQGEVVTLTPDMIALLQQDNPEMKVESGTITLTAADAGRATFAIDMVALRQDGMVDMRIPMNLTAVCEIASLHLVELSMTGTMDGTAGGMPMTGTLEGKKTSVVK